MDIASAVHGKKRNALPFLAAGIIAFAMLAFAFGSMTKDSLTFDELAHIGAGYSYLTQQDYRLNPEHPPLAKDLAAFPLLFLHLNFPMQSQTWLQDSGAPPWWMQFNFGTELLYSSGNNPRQIILWARTPMILLSLALGLFIFFWARKIAGNTGGLLAFLLYALSPTFLAHGRLVTTDVAAAFGAVEATYFWLQFLKNPSKKNIFMAGIALGIALCLKFTLVLLIPFFGILTILYPFILPPQTISRIKLAMRFALKAIIAGIIGLLFIVWPIYQFHIWHYPASRQVRDTIADLSPGGITAIEKATIFMADKPALRPFAQFARGILMANQRVTFGNTTYFLGQVSSSGWKSYFPTLFFLKEPLPFYALLCIALIGIFISLKKQTRAWIHEHFSLAACFLFLVIYWASALIGNLNIGIRHLIPTFPFLYILSAWGIPRAIISINKKIVKTIAIGGIALLLLWFAAASKKAFPFYISYFNELAGGTKNGYKIAVDSNYDWGQDFYRLLELIKKYQITTLHLDYFGGENPRYWLSSAYVPSDPNATPHPTGWIAVSANQLQGGKAIKTKGYDQSTDYYSWLNDKYLVARAGTSIFLYFIP